MSPSELLTALDATLRPVVISAGGQLDIASDPDHAIEILTSAAPRGWRLILSYAGDTAPQPDTARGILECEIAVIIQAPRGLAIRTGSTAHLPGPGDTDPILKLRDTVSAWLRSLVPPENADLQTRTDIDWRGGLRHISTAWLDIENLPTRQLVLTRRITIAETARTAPIPWQTLLPTPEPEPEP
jgi:hypothetical protein